MEQVIYVNKKSKRVVAEGYPNSHPYIDKDEYDKLCNDYDELDKMASDLRYQCVVHEECRKDLERKYAEAQREIERLNILLITSNNN